MGLPIRAVNVTRKVKVDLFRWSTVCFEQGKVIIPDHEKLLLHACKSSLELLSSLTAKHNGIIMATLKSIIMD